jgi:hypothetical protein
MNVNDEGRRRMMIKVIIGLRKRALSAKCGIGAIKTYEYHSQAEYSALINSESVRKPECVVLEADMSE